MVSTAGRKLFVGSLPQTIGETSLRAEFQRYGPVEDVFVKPGCAPGKQWAFVTMVSPASAQMAKDACDRVLLFPGADRPCDVMVAKNQGMFGQANDAPLLGANHNSSNIPVYLGQPTYEGGGLSPIQGRKIFVGSLPDGITEAPLRAEYSQHGQVEDVFIKPGCELGRQWAFLTFATPEQAQHALEATHGILKFPGTQRACEVTLARNQGMFGQDPIMPGPPKGGQPAVDPAAPGHASGYGGAGGHVSVGHEGLAPKKIFVGSMPETITDPQIRAEFSKFGQIVDLHINNRPCEPGRQWAFITFATADQAQLAKVGTDRTLVFPGAERACEVTLARHQGMYGQDIPGAPQHAIMDHHGAAGNTYTPPTQQGPKKIFVGSLPETADVEILRAEFSRYGQVVDVFLNSKPREPGRNWAFVTFASMEQAMLAKDSTDRALCLPGADRPCEVMMAKNQGMFGQDPVAGAAGHAGGHGSSAGYAGWDGGAGCNGAGYASTAGYAHAGGYAPYAALVEPEVQPPPPPGPAPAHLTPWRMYRTAAGLPYYHNPMTGVTQWECPPDLQVPGQTSPYAPQPIPVAPQQVRYSPY